jgi:quercetin dioxygenase-like cupin family protein
MNLRIVGAAVCLAGIVLVGAVALSSAQGKAPTENKGLNTEELASLDLTTEMAAVQGRKLRLRHLTLQPGGVIALHSHADRPDASYLLKGTVVIHQDGIPDVARRVGSGSVSGKSATHWVENTGNEPAELIVADIVRLDGAPAAILPQGTAPTRSKGLSEQELGVLTLANEIESVQGRRLRLRHSTLQPRGVTALHSHTDRPTAVYLLKGTLAVHQEGVADGVLRPGSAVMEGKGITHWGENPGSEPTEFIVVDILKS